MDDANPNPATGDTLDPRDHARSTRGQSGQPAFASTRPRRARWIGVLFGAGIVAMAAAAVVSALPYDRPDRTTLLDGEVTRSFESHYDEVFPVKTFGTNLWAAIQYLLFGEGRSGVVVGEGGWLYTDEEFRSYPDAGEQIEARLRFIDEVRARMKERGTELVIALVPAKQRLYPEHRGEHRPAAIHRDLYARLHGELKLRGIVAPDLLAALSRCKARTQVFLRTDTHWTPEGAACGAQALAGAFGPVRDSAEFETQVQGEKIHAGDLMKFLPLSPYFDALLPPPDRVIVRSTTAAGGADALLAPTEQPQTVLIGTSYSADTSWNFDGALRESFDDDVLNLAEPGRGPFAPMRDYLTRPLAQASPRRLIWEIPERYLPAADPQPGGAQKPTELARADAS